LPAIMEANSWPSLHAYISKYPWSFCTIGRVEVLLKQLEERKDSRKQK
jgi:hypothetical protein